MVSRISETITDTGADHSPSQALGSCRYRQPPRTPGEAAAHFVRSRTVVQFGLYGSLDVDVMLVVVAIFDRPGFRPELRAISPPPGPVVVPVPDLDAASVAFRIRPAPRGDSVVSQCCSCSRIISASQAICSPGSMKTDLPGHVCCLDCPGMASAGRPSCEISCGVGKLGDPTWKRLRISCPWLMVELRSVSWFSRCDRSGPGGRGLSCRCRSSALCIAFSISFSSRGRIWSTAWWWSANVKPCRAHA